MADALTIPADLKPADGRFGAGPSKIQTGHLDALAATGSALMGTSHRQAPVRQVVGRVRDGLAALFDMPADYEVVLGNGGATAFWDVATYGLIREKSQHLTFGEFSSKFAKAVTDAPWLSDPSVISSDPGSLPTPAAEEGVDAYAWAHNETSTAVMAPVERPEGTTAEEALVLVDATSGAGGLPVDLNQVGRLLLRARRSASPPTAGSGSRSISPAAIERVAEIKGSGRHVPAFFDLDIAVTQSRLNQTYNTPSVATMFLMAEQLDWMNGQGGLAGMVERTTASSDALYGWAEKTSYTTPYVPDPDHRSLVIGTIDFDDAISADAIAATLRANGIVDTEPYRKLGRNQLRIAMYPAIDPADVEALTTCIDWVVDNSYSVVEVRGALSGRASRPPVDRSSGFEARRSTPLARSTTDQAYGCFFTRCSSRSLVSGSVVIMAYRRAPSRPCSTNTNRFAFRSSSSHQPASAMNLCSSVYVAWSRSWSPTCTASRSLR